MSEDPPETESQLLTDLAHYGEWLAATSGLDIESPGPSAVSPSAAGADALLRGDQERRAGLRRILVAVGAVLLLVAGFAWLRSSPDDVADVEVASSPPVDTLFVLPETDGSQVLTNGSIGRGPDPDAPRPQPELLVVGTPRGGDFTDITVVSTSRLNPGDLAEWDVESVDGATVRVFEEGFVTAVREIGDEWLVVATRPGGAAVAVELAGRATFDDRGLIDRDSLAPAIVLEYRPERVVPSPASTFFEVTGGGLSGRVTVETTTYAVLLEGMANRDVTLRPALVGGNKGWHASSEDADGVWNGLVWSFDRDRMAAVSGHVPLAELEDLATGVVEVSEEEWREATDADVPSSDTTTTTQPAPTAAPVPAEIPGIAESGRVDLPQPPLSVRGDAALVWTGAELVVWGGDVEAANMGLPGPDRTFADGAAFDPATSTWRTMTDGPLPATADDSVGLLTSNGVLLARGRSVALWEPSSNEWTSLPDAPAEIDDLVGGDDFAISASANAVLDLNSQAWSTLPPPPLDLQRPSSVWTGSSLIVIGGPDTPFTDAAAISYDPVLDEWTTLPDIPDLSATATAAVWDGSRVIAAEYDMAAVAYDPLTDEWTQLPPVPARFFEWYPAMFSTGQTTLVAMAQAVVLLRNDAWFPLPAQALSDGGLSEIVPIAGSSGTFFVWSVDKDAAVNRLSAVDPNIVYSTTRTVQVGVAGLTLDDDTEPLAATYTTERGEQVMVELLVGDEACTMTSTYSAGGQDPTWEQINLSNDDADTPWRANPDATVLNTAPTTSDLVEIRCERPATTLELASRATFTLHVQRDD